MEKIKTFRDLIVWRKSMLLVTDVYGATGRFPREEMFGLTSQMRRCAVSIPSNIAEGYGRQATGDYIRFLQIALGSLYELHTQYTFSNKVRTILSVSRRLDSRVQFNAARSVVNLDLN